jgi:hypothetical protein
LTFLPLNVHLLFFSSCSTELVWMLVFCIAVCCRVGLSGAAGLTDFADDVADLVAAAGEGEKAGGSLSALYGKQRLSQKYGADLAMQQQSKVGGGLCMVSHGSVYHMHDSMCKCELWPGLRF